MRERMADGRSTFLGQADPEPITLADPRPEWVEQFERLRVALAAALGPSARIEHVGSTSISGLAAKPIIDVLISVPDLADEKRYVPQIESVGVALRMRENDKGHVYFRNNSPRTTHIHVCQIGSMWERDHLLFRDYLRAHAEAARVYEAVKRAAAETYRDDRIAYTESKGPVIESILVKANDWADETGWTP
jgi:GrpB-like predicted nucleotidyltransferase (UPF0157 family)